MSVSVTLPQMGESVTEGTIIQWLKQEGDQVEEDEPLVEISTDKIDTELPSPTAGVLKTIKVGPDQTVEVGTELAVIDEAGGDGKAPEAETEEKEPEEKEKEPKAKPASKEPKAKAEKKEADKEPQEEKAAPEPAAKKAPPKRPPAKEPAAKETPARVHAGDGAGSARALSPLVRKLARELDVDLGSVEGTGSGGRITKDDVIGAARAGGAPPRRAGPAAPAPSQFEVPAEEHLDVPFTRVRKAISEHMRRSRSTAAHVTNIIEVDVTEIAELRARAKDGFRRREGVSLTFMPFIASAVVQALRTYPEFNAHLLEDGTSARLYHEINLGIAVGRDEGLIVPVVHGAERLNLVGLATAIADVGERARTKGALTPDDVTGGTFTITNYGSVGGVMDTPIINQPQVAILGVGRVVKRPAVIDADGVDAIAIRHQLFLSLSYDHRWIDGHRAAQFNSRLKDLLETTDFSADLGL